MAKVLLLDPAGTAELEIGEDGTQTATRTARVIGTTGTTEHDRLFDALETSGLPAQGDPLSATRPTLVLTTISPRMGRDGEVDIRLGYKTLSTSGGGGGGNDGFAKISVSTDAEQVETIEDADGNQINVSYAYPATSAGEYYPTQKPEWAGMTIPQVGKVSVNYDRQTIVWQRFERVNPMDRIKYLWNSVCALGWLIDPTADGLWKLRCTAEAATDGWDFTYTAKYSPIGWKAYAIYTDPWTGQTPDDVVEGVGKKEIEVYRSVDYNTLNLPVLGATPPVRTY